MCRSWFSRRAGNYATEDLEVDPRDSSDEKDNRHDEVILSPRAFAAQR